MKPYYESEDGKVTLYLGDCRESLKALADNSVDSIVTDPPAGIKFMAKTWDSDKGGRDKWIAWLEGIAVECKRVLKPGGHAFVWALPRTSHWTGMAWENAGFEPRHKVCHLFGSGFPKSHSISKAIQKKFGIKPIGEKEPSLGMATGPNSDQWNQLNKQLVMPEPEGEAADWDGFGTALKPSQENWWLFRKPVEGTIASNVQEYGTGALNIDGCRVGCFGGTTKTAPERRDSVNTYGDGLNGGGCANIDAGRWPPDTLLSHDESCVLVGTREVKTGTAVQENRDGEVHNTVLGARKTQRLPNASYGKDGMESVELWACVPGCPVRTLDEQSMAGGIHGAGKKGKAKSGSGIFFKDGKTDTAYRLGDKGGASRFFPTFYYCPKPSKSEKNKGCENLPAKTPEEMTGRKEGSAGLVMKHDDGSDKANPYAGTSGEARRNSHPTPKPVKLMRWLCRLITPPGGRVLDPFAGSGTTGVAAIEEGFSFIGMDMSEEYLEISKARIGAAEPAIVPEPIQVEAKPGVDPEQMNPFDETPSLFGEPLNG